ncbi:MAG: hypothetical protein ACI9U1_000376 [Porticoccaceae bacterium]|jgi:hypothetical protein
MPNKVPSSINEVNEIRIRLIGKNTKFALGINATRIKDGTRTPITEKTIIWEGSRPPLG